MITLNYNKRNRKVKGFTLLETLTSIAILSLTVIGPVAVMVDSSSYARDAQDVMTARYLAEESLELLQNKADSIYIFCRKNPNDAKCAVEEIDESSSDVAWRVFKDDVGSSTPGVPSCYESVTSSGCTFDYLGMTQEATSSPQIFTVEENQELYLSSATVPHVDNEGHTTLILRDNISASTTATSTLVKDQFAKTSVILEQKPNYEVDEPARKQRHDDMRATVKAQVKGSGKKVKEVKIRSYIFRRGGAID